MTQKSVLLAPNEQLKWDSPYLRWPLLGSRKYDGVRCVIVEGVAYSRSMKPFPNVQFNEWLRPLRALSAQLKLVFDMEVYDHSLPDFGKHLSVLRANDAPVPDTFACYVFDTMPQLEWDTRSVTPFARRHQEFSWLDIENKLPLHFLSVEQRRLENREQAEEFYTQALAEGYEGLMLRSPHGLYKHGRATLHEGIIYKFKDFHTDDAVILDLLPRRKMRDEVRLGERELTPTGKLERVHTKDSFEDTEVCGSLLVRLADGTESEINYGRGFNLAQRAEHWQQREGLRGKYIEVRHLPHGAKEGIRIGTLVRFRPDLDEVKGE